MFVDRTTLQLKAGKGGNGVVAWRREKYVPKGGPFGGDGGKGGSVVIRADAQLGSLEALRNRRVLAAENGVQGGANLRQGRSGKTVVIKVPCGTLVKDVASGEVLRDLTEDGEEWIICQGGRGGRGNAHFKSPTNRAPNYCTPGREGESCAVEFELKLIADVALVGYPNAGKSTLVNALTYTRVKIGAYPFTTLYPNLGFLTGESKERILLADVPGIIEGAHNNKGLGLEFLRHIERTKALVYVLDASGIDGRHPSDDYSVLRDELAAYREELLERPFVVILNKTDAEESVEKIREFHEQHPELQTFLASALNGDGLDHVADAIRGSVASKEAPGLQPSIASLMPS